MEKSFKHASSPLDDARFHSWSACLEGARAFRRAVKSRYKDRLYRPLKKSFRERFVTGHDFSRADKPFYFPY